MATVPTEVSERDFTGNAATADFPLPFPILDTSDLVVTVDDVLQVEGTDYEVDAAPSDAPTVTMTVAPANGAAVHIERTLPITQLVNLLTQGPMSPESFTRIDDKIVMIAQQLKRAIAQLQALGSLVPVGSFEALVREKTFDTDVDAVENTFPITVALPADFIPTGVWKVKIINNTDPAAEDEHEAVEVRKWSAAALSLTIDFITGLAPGTNYTIRLMMVATEVT